MKNKKLSNGYSYEIDQITKDEWHKMLLDFDDATIYQTWSYGEIRWGGNKTSHVILKKDNEIVAAVQARLILVPFIGGGIAYIPWGPMWKRKNKEANPELLRQIIRVLINEFVIKQKLFLNILSHEIDENENYSRKVYKEEGYSESLSPYRTIILDLSLSLDELVANMESDWRRILRKSEKQNFDITSGYDNNKYDELALPYHEMIARKNFKPGVNIEQFRRMQEDLPPELKMNIIVCKNEHKPVSTILGSYIGDMGIIILGGSNEVGLKLKGSYQTPWLVVKWLKENGAKWCDLGGYNPDRNPGTGRFKRGIGGKDIRHLGRFDACRSFRSKLYMVLADIYRNYKTK
jgi:lipid II:glycine glycyltransferase (peptidoglycan interpeptide bridge formation enzyme)